MAQVNFAFNIGYLGPSASALSINNNSLTLVPFNFFDQISALTLNFAISQASTGNRTITFNFGMYSIISSTGSAFSLMNYFSGTTSSTNSGNFYMSLTDTSSTQNISPGTWYFGVLVSANSGGPYRFFGANIQASNAFFNQYLGGAMSVSTNALPASIATSDVDITAGSGEFSVPMIILSA